ncbi:methionine biosynthesis protein MetW [Porticoccaceae bacterium]|nr:methionine biosynthesis protein MetW [Porticoccaceae bacterium]MDA8936651.1 methionine biosynthesis protein MetW [Porticoccaceae bacterium]
MNQDFDIIHDWITPSTRVLDLGCGDGALLLSLQQKHNILGYGLEVDPQAINQCIARGVNVIEQDLNKGLTNFADGSFDTVVMTQALQAMRLPHLVLDEMLRIGRECIITFPNFGYWRTRAYLNFRGRMPVTKQLAYQWYDTPNIHFFTYADFETLCAERNINILHRQCISEHFPDTKLKSLWPNLFTQTAVYHLSR